MRLRDAWLAAALLELVAGCRKSAHDPRPADAAPAPLVLRFPPGGAAPPLGCFAWSKDLATHACTLGHQEDEPDGTSLGVAFVGPTPSSGIVLDKGRLDDAGRATLDAAMVAGSYVTTDDRPWVAPGQRMTVGDHIVSLEGDTVRVERGGAKIFERVEHRTGRFVTHCQLRAALQGSTRIIVERRCLTRDEGVVITDLDAWWCDATHCT